MNFTCRVTFVTAVAVLIVLEISLPFLPESQTGAFQPKSVLVDIT